MYFHITKYVFSELKAIGMEGGHIFIRALRRLYYTTRTEWLNIEADDYDAAAIFII